LLLAIVPLVIQGATGGYERILVHGPISGQLCWPPNPLHPVNFTLLPLAIDLVSLVAHGVIARHLTGNTASCSRSLPVSCRSGFSPRHGDGPFCDGCGPSCRLLILLILAKLLTSEISGTTFRTADRLGVAPGWFLRHSTDPVGGIGNRSPALTRKTRRSVVILLTAVRLARR
jgi:hypothetical protein